MAKKLRGFALQARLDPDRQRAWASRGGKAAHAKGAAHRFTSETGRAAGRLGGRGRWKAPKHAREPNGERAGMNGYGQ